MQEEYELEKRKVGDYDAIIYYDPLNARYTIAYNGKNGAIISEYNIVDAEKKFIDAMDICMAAQQSLNVTQNER